MIDDRLFLWIIISGATIGTVMMLILLVIGFHQL